MQTSTNELHLYIAEAKSFMFMYTVLLKCKRSTIVSQLTITMFPYGRDTPHPSKVPLLIMVPCAHPSGGGVA